MKLKITHSSESPDRHRVEVSIDDNAAATPGGEFDFTLTAGDQESLRWYWEDYLEYPVPPARDNALEVERRITEIGTQLFQATFQGSGAEQLWKKVQPRLASTRIEVSSSAAQTGCYLPWELLRDPATDTILSATAQSFVRVPDAADPGAPPAPAGGSPPLRVLTVLCRPPCKAGSPFRSPAARLLQSLSAEIRNKVQLQLLRPPTFGQLSSVLLEAEAMGAPYHVVHIDGYAVFSDVEMDGTPEEVLEFYREPQFSSVLRGPHGYLVFEDATADQNCHLVNGASLCQVLKEARVGMLALAACAEAHIGLNLEPAAPEFAQGSLVEAFHSLAADATSHGVPAVICLPYGLDPAHAATVFGRTYAALAGGEAIGETVTRLRKQLRDLPDRQVTYGPVPVPDWAVPIVYETAPLSLVQTSERASVALPVEVLSADEAQDSPFPPGRLPKPPLTGFLGRNETMLAIDRVFDTHSVALLEGEKGQGKTAASGEFARWYARTSGFEGAVLFTSFDHHKRLAAVLDQLAGEFDEALEKAGYEWARLPAEERLEVALHVLNQIPVLWIWDNIGRVEGEQGGPASAPEEQEELANFLRVARETQAKFLLTSRRASHRWLGALPTTVQLTGLPMRERLQLARALAERNGSWLTEVDDWRPALEFSGGNPLALRCLVEQIVRQGLESTRQIRSFVEQLRSRASGAGEQPDAALNAVLDYVLSQGISENEQRILALLHLFHGVADVRRLAAMGEGEESASVPGIQSLAEFRELTEDPESTVLERAASLGLLTAEGDGVYSIHPALPPFLDELFDRHFSARQERKKDKRFPLSFKSRGPHLPSPSTRAARAYVRSLSDFGLRSFEQFRNGEQAVLSELAVEEENLQHACTLAREFAWWDLITGCIHGLGALYEGSNRIAEWSDFFEELMADCSDQSTQQPLPGREQYWRAVTQQGVHIATRTRHLPRAEELQRLCLNWDREQAGPFLAMPTEQLDDSQRAVVDRFALSLHRLGELLRRQGFPELKIDEEAVELKERLGEKEAASRWAFELGFEYADDLALRDLVRAERWLQRSLELKDEEDRSGKAACYARLGRVAWERFGETRKSNRPQVELLRHLNDARQYYLRALENDPPDDSAKLAAHNQELGHICFSLGDLDRALPYYRESVRYYEKEGNTAQVAQIQFTLALSLRDANRMAEARKFARGAHTNFQKVPDGDPEMINRAKRILESIEGKIEAKKQAQIEQSEA